MTTTGIDIKALMQPYAEAKAWVNYSEDDPATHTPVPDPRFQSLRGEHDVDGGGRGVQCHGCDWEGDEGDWPDAPYCLNTSLGALLDVAIACGKEVVTAVLVELTIDMENRLALPELRAQPLAGPIANVIVRMVPLP